MLPLACNKSHLTLLSFVLLFRPSATVNVRSPDTTTVPLVFGNVIVLSAVGSTTVSVVSKSSFVAPSKTIVPSSATVMFEDVINVNV